MSYACPTLYGLQGLDADFRIYIRVFQKVEVFQLKSIPAITKKTLKIKANMNKRTAEENKFLLHFVHTSIIAIP